MCKKVDGLAFSVSSLIKKKVFALLFNQGVFVCEVVWFSYYACIKEPMEHLFVVKEILFMYAGRKKPKFYSKSVLIVLLPCFQVLSLLF